MKAGKTWPEGPPERNPPASAGPTPSEMALLALAFLARDKDRAARFLALTGLDGADVSSMLGDPGFQLAVLDHIAGDEALLLTFAVEHALPPEAVGRTRRALGGGEV